MSTLIEGRERYAVNARYQRDFPSDPEALGRVLVPAGGGSQVPPSQLATIQMATGPAMLRDEDGLLTGYVFVDVADRPLGDYVAQAGPRATRRADVKCGEADLRPIDILSSR